MYAIRSYYGIGKLSNPMTVTSDFVRPGHIFPLIAKDGGTLVRTGHTEGSVDLCKLAGLAPAAVICEIIKDDGTMARMDDLKIVITSYSIHYTKLYEKCRKGGRWRSLKKACLR